MLIIQNGYECDYEMKLFYKLYFDMNEDIYCLLYTSDAADE